MKRKRDTKRRNITIALVISLVVIIAAFFVNSYLNPQTSNTWISVDQSMLSIGAIQFGINEGAIWEINNDGNELRQHIYDTFQIKVNGEPIAKEHIIFLESFGSSVPTPEFSNGEEAGFHYEGVWVYVLDFHLQPGTYTLEISTTSMSGILYRYTQEVTVLNPTPTTSQ